jgi:hypothetical protein
MYRWSIRSVPFGVVIVLATGAAAAGTALVAEAATAPPRPVARTAQLGATVADCRQGEAVHKVYPGQCLVVTAHGFAALEQLQVRLLTTSDVTDSAAADRHGIVRYRFVLPSSTPAGPEVLTIVGLGAANPKSGSAAAGNVTVTVPRFAVAHLTVSRAVTHAAGNE